MTPGVPATDFANETRFDAIDSLLEDLLRLLHGLAPEEVAEQHQARLERVESLVRESPSPARQAKLEAEQLVLQVYARIFGARAEDS